jgi:hypothetical protein
MDRVSPADLGDRRDDLRLDQAAATHLVSRNVSGDPDQTGHLQPRTWPPPRRVPDHGVGTSSTSSNRSDGVRRTQATNRTGRNEQRLSRRRTLRRHARLLERCRSSPRSRPPRTQAGPYQVGLGQCVLQPGAAGIHQALPRTKLGGRQPWSSAFASVTEAGCVVTRPSGQEAGSRPCARLRSRGVNTPLGNLRAVIVGTYRSINSKHVPRLAEFEHRFNRRYDLAAMLPRLCWVRQRTTPMPCWLLKLAEVYA